MWNFNKTKMRISVASKDKTKVETVFLGLKDKVEVFTKTEVSIL